MTKTPTEEAVDLDGLQRLFERIPPGPYDALHRQDGWEVRQIDTDPRDKHHWPYRLCERIAGQAAECDDAVFPFIAGVINAWPTLLSELSRLQAERDRAVEALTEARDLLLERIHGSPARSAAHNARVRIESALASLLLPPPVKEAEPRHDGKDWIVHEPHVEAASAQTGIPASVIRAAVRAYWDQGHDSDAAALQAVKEAGAKTTEYEDAMRESAYLAGMKAGWNFGVVEDKDGYLKAVEAREGYLKPILAARAARSAEPVKEAEPGAEDVAENVILTGDDADRAIDAALTGEREDG